MSVFITGASGFVGTRLINRLLKNELNIVNYDKTLSLFHPDLTTLGDVRDYSKLVNSIDNGSIIINLAAEHRDDVRPKSLYDEVNVEGAKNICRAADENGVDKIVFTSSVAVYGFAPLGIDETADINPFNDYGRTKWEAEKVFRRWQSDDSENRSLVIIRPTVIFGERNRGNVYNLLRQIASGKFLMVGDGRNRKSMAYVENVAAFIEESLNLGVGIHTYNYIDKPDFDMNTLVAKVNGILGRNEKIGFRLPYYAGLAIGKVFDFVALLLGRTFPISSIRVKKFCSDSVYNTSIDATGFKPVVDLEKAIAGTVKYEFVDGADDDRVFYTE